jgi:hypothetical protein
MRPRIIAATVIFCVGSDAATADEAAAVWRPDIVALYESAGGQNVPNYRYDGPHGHYTGGGPCQMTNTNWRRIAPTIDIDLAKFPTAGTASEHQQWQACWKLWSLDGYSPWTCCNSPLRKALRQARISEKPPLTRAAEIGVDPVNEKTPSVEEKPHDWDVFPDDPAEAPVAPATRPTTAAPDWDVFPDDPAEAPAAQRATADIGGNQDADLKAEP